MAVIALAASMVLAPALTAPASAAPSQTCGDYPPQGQALESQLSITQGLLTPGTSTGSIVLGGAVPGGVYSGTLIPGVTLPASTASPTGVVTFSSLIIPAGFTLRAVHHIEVSRSCALVAAFDACVTSGGTLALAKSCAAVAATAGAAGAAGTAGGALPRTGMDHVFQILQLGALAIAVGTFLLYVRRRTIVAHATARA